MSSAMVVFLVASSPLALSVMQDTNGPAQFKRPFLVGNGTSMRNPPSLFRTPPYVNATPVVTHRKVPLSENGQPGKPNYFLVMATDGLWDELSNDDVVSLVGGYLAGLKGKVPKSDLRSMVPISTGAEGVEGKREKKANKIEGSWAFIDENPSVHLIRNAFGGGDEDALRRRLSIPAPYSRRYRDDVTVTVVWWENNGTQHQTQLNREQLREQMKAKL